MNGRVSEIEIRKSRQQYERGGAGEKRMGMRRRDRGSDYISTNNDGIPGRFGDKKKFYHF